MQVPRLSQEAMVLFRPAPEETVRERVTALPPEAKKPWAPRTTRR